MSETTPDPIPTAESPSPRPPPAEPRDSGSGGLRPPLREHGEEEFGGAGRLKSLDADIEKELAEAMHGFSEKELLAGTVGAPEPSRGPAGPEDKRKKGKVLAIRGGDVFIDVPGGRS